MCSTAFTLPKRPIPSVVPVDDAPVVHGSPVGHVIVRVHDGVHVIHLGHVDVVDVIPLGNLTFATATYIEQL